MEWRRSRWEGSIAERGADLGEMRVGLKFDWLEVGGRKKEVEGVRRAVKMRRRMLALAGSR